MDLALCVLPVYMYCIYGYHVGGVLLDGVAFTIGRKSIKSDMFRTCASYILMTEFHTVRHSW
jgi:hypothetical protein